MTEVLADRPDSPLQAQRRLASIDALRGFDMIWILGGEGVVHAAAKMSDAKIVTALNQQFSHSAWEGVTFYDLIFPLFIFITGISLVLSLNGVLAREGRRAALLRVARRSLILFVFGLLYYGALASPWPEIRLFGVLQRIAVVYGVGGVLFCCFRPRVLAAVAAVILIAYWPLLALVPVRNIELTDQALKIRAEASGLHQPAWDNGALGRYPQRSVARQLFFETSERVRGHYERGLNLPNHVDFEFLPGKKSHFYFDAEGLLSTSTAVASCLLGILAGVLLRRPDWSERRKVTILVIAGGASVSGGLVWGLWFPVIKRLWTSSFVLVTTGFCLWLLAASYHLVDRRGLTRWVQPFIWVGANAILLYMLGGGVVDFERLALRFCGGDVTAFLNNHLVPGAGEMMQALCTVTLVFALARYLYLRKIFVRI